LAEFPVGDWNRCVISPKGLRANQSVVQVGMNDLVMMAQRLQREARVTICWVVSGAQKQVKAQAQAQAQTQAQSRKQVL